MSVTYNFWGSDDPSTWGEIGSTTSRDVYFYNFFTEGVTLTEISFYGRNNGFANAYIELSIYQDSNLIYTSGALYITNTDTEKITLNPAVTISQSSSLRIYINRSNCSISTSTYAGQVGYLKYQSGIYPVLEMTFDDFNITWFSDTDGYPVTIASAVNSEPFSGFDNPYSILDAWKLDSNNNNYPWTFGWDEPAPPPTGNWFIKTTNGLQPLTWYIKNSGGNIVPLNMSVKT